MREFRSHERIAAEAAGPRGVVNVITRSGTSDLHGGAFFFYRDTNLNANNAVTRPTTPPCATKFRQFGANPVRAGYQEQDFLLQLRWPAQFRTGLSLPPAGLVASFPPCRLKRKRPIEPLSPPTTKDYARGLNNDVFLFKTDWNASRNQTVNFRWNGNRFTGRNFENAGAQRASEATGDSKVLTDSFVGTYTRIIGSYKVWDLRYSHTRDDQPGEANSNAPETTVQQGGQNVIVFGRNTSPRLTNSSHSQIISTFALDHRQTYRQNRRRCGFERITNFSRPVRRLSVPVTAGVRAEPSLSVSAGASRARNQRRDFQSRDIDEYAFSSGPMARSTTSSPSTMACATICSIP